MSGIGLLHSVNRERANGVDAELRESSLGDRLSYQRHAFLLATRGDRPSRTGADADRIDCIWPGRVVLPPRQRTLTPVAIPIGIQSTSWNSGIPFLALAVSLNLR